MEIELDRKIIGTMSFPNEHVDITDPCYDKDIWCRITINNLMPGTYNCYAYTGNDELFGNRCWVAQIVIADGDEADYANKRINDANNWTQIGIIGVDAGLAGFFPDKPDFSDDDWTFFCESLGNEDAFLDETLGFWTRSGCGDGGYPVYAIEKQDKVIALEIRFT